MKSLFAAALLALALTGCATPEVPKPVALVPEAEYAALVQAQATAGTGSVSGKFYLTDRRGQISYGSNNKLVMWPATPYMQVWVKAVEARTDVPFSSDPRMAAFYRSAPTNKAGEFHFEGVPAGAYFIWGFLEMNFIIRRVVVEEGQQTNAFITND